MTRYLLDTNHASVLPDRSSPLWQRMASAADARFALCRPSVGELWFMVYNSARVDRNRTRLMDLLRELPVVDYDAAAAEEYGRIRVELRRAGRPIPQIDIQIAAIARVGGYTLLTADAHFASVPALPTGNWLKP